MEAALFVVLVLGVTLGAFALWIWTLVDVVKVPSDDRFPVGDRVTWILVVVLAGIIGSIIYLVVGRPPAGWRR